MSIQVKNPFEFKSIRSRLVFSFTGLLMLVVGLTGWYLMSLSNVVDYHEVSSELDQLSAQILEMRNAETKYLKYDVSDEEYYKSETSLFYQEVFSIAKKNEQLIDELLKKDLIQQSGLMEDLELVKTLNHNYQDSMTTLSSKVIEKGFKDFGVIGELRSIIHKVEHADISYDRAQMLMLRRNEKDFLLRKDLKYKDKFAKNADIFRADIALLDVSEEKKAGMIAQVDEYQVLFNKMIAIQGEIGFSPKSGILGQLNSQGIQMERLTKSIKTDIRSILDVKSQRMMWSMFGGLAIVLVLFVFASIRLIVRLEKPLNVVKENMDKISKGVIPEKIIDSTTDVIMKTINGSLNLMIERTSNVTQFAEKVGKEEYDANIRVLSEEDVLGISLNEMKGNLIKAKENAEAQRIQDERRHWTTEGLALFAGIIRENNEDLQVLCDEIIKNYVKYLGVNQGGVFLIEEVQGTDMIVGKSAYAYGRKKFFEKSKRIGEGVLGQCVLEKEPIYLTDIPQDYIQITSGLGDANPCAILLVPIMQDNEVYGVIELASFTAFEEHKRDLVIKTTEGLASAIYAVKMNMTTKKLLSESQQMSEELRAQEEEMRQNLEELTATQEEQQRREVDLLSQIDELKGKRQNEASVY